MSRAHDLFKGRCSQVPYDLGGTGAFGRAPCSRAEPREQGSGYPVQVLGRVNGLRAFPYYPSRARSRRAIGSANWVRESLRE